MILLSRFLTAENRFLMAVVFQLMKFPSVLTICVLLLSSYSLPAQEKTLIATAAVAVAQSKAKEVKMLEVNNPLTRELAGGEKHVYQVKLEAGQFARIAVEQQGIDLVVTLFDSSGKLLFEMDSSIGEFGAEELLLIAESSGTFKVEVVSLNKKAIKNNYKAVLANVHFANAKDKVLIAAQTALINGNKVRDADESEEQKAVDQYAEALLLTKVTHDNQGSLRVLNEIASIYEERGQLDKSLNYYEQMIPLLKYAEESYLKSSYNANIGNIYSETANYRKALLYYQQVLSFMKSIGNRKGEAYTLNLVGVSHNRLDEWQTAISSYHQALRISEAIGDLDGAAMMTGNIGNIYSSLKEPQKALSYYELALRKVKSDSLYFKGAMLNNIAREYIALGKNQEGLAYLQQALAIVRQLKNVTREVIVLAGICSMHNKLKEFSKALQCHQQALELSKSSGNAKSVAQLLNLIGEDYYDLGELDKSVDTLNQALAAARSIQDRGVEHKSLALLSAIEKKRNNFGASREYLESALKIVESQRTKLSNNEMQASFFARYRSYYDSYIEMLMTEHSKEPLKGFDVAALQVSERARARGLLDALIEARADLIKGVNPALLSRLNLSQQQLAEAAAQKEKLNNTEVAEKRTELEQKISELSDEVQQIEAEIKSKSPDYAALIKPEPLSLAQIQQQVLDANSLLLVYALGDENSYLWTITTDSLTSYQLPKREAVERTARKMYESMAARNQILKEESLAQRKSRLKKAEADYAQAAAELSQMVLVPAAARLKNKTRIVVIADGALQYLPFVALPAPATDTEDSSESMTGKLLIDEHEIVNLPSASALAVMRQSLSGRVTASKEVAVLADPVFSSNDSRFDLKKANQNRFAFKSDKQSANDLTVDNSFSEITRSAKDVGLMTAEMSAGDLPRLAYTREIAATLFDKKSESLAAFDFRASRETALSGELANYRTIIFATHGLLNSQHPELSGLVLSLVDETGKPQNGFLRLQDVYNMRLNADLVVLAACETGLGKDVRSEGLVGLTRGFMYAGAKSVMASLWKVDEEATVELVKKFYQRIAAEQSPSAALRQTQIEMRQKQRWQAPYYWAGFTLQGDWR